MLVDITTAGFWKGIDTYISSILIRINLKICMYLINNQNFNKCQSTLICIFYFVSGKYDNDMIDYGAQFSQLFRKSCIIFFIINCFELK